MWILSQKKKKSFKMSYSKVKISSACHSHSPPTRKKNKLRQENIPTENFGQLYLMTTDKEVPGRLQGLQSIRHKGSEKIFSCSILFFFFIFSTLVFISLLFWYNVIFFHISPFFPLFILYFTSLGVTC